jgi:hypothetical protein
MYVLNHFMETLSLVDTMKQEVQLQATLSYVSTIHAEIA